MQRWRRFASRWPPDLIRAYRMMHYVEILSDDLHNSIVHFRNYQKISLRLRRWRRLAQRDKMPLKRPNPVGSRRSAPRGVEKFGGEIDHAGQLPIRESGL